MIRDESWKGRGRRSTALTTEKIAVLAPMPKARRRTAVAEKPGLRRRIRKPSRRSETKLRMGKCSPGSPSIRDALVTLIRDEQNGQSVSGGGQVGTRQNWELRLAKTRSTCGMNDT